MPIQQMLLGTGAVATKPYIDDVFSSYVYTGTGSAKTITNGINLSGEGGMVWLKGRSSGKDHKLTDTVRGVNSQLMSQDTSAATTLTNLITSFNNNGFTMGSHAEINQSGVTQASWSFRKAKGFFTCLSYVGSGSNRTISHDLGCVPGMIIIKSLDDTEWWAVYHRQLNGGTNPEQYYLRLNGNNAEASSADLWNNTAPTSTNFSLGTGNAVNKNGDDYIAYLFAHDDQSFGENENASVIKCGTYTTDSNEDATINLGWEPQWVLAKRIDSNSAADWMIVDSMRGFPNAQNVEQNNSGECNVLEANTNEWEINTSRLGLTSTGFYADQFGSNREFIYMAIRRPDGYCGKPVEDATKVFTMSTGNSSSFPAFTSGFPVDLALQRRPATSNQSFMLATRLTGKYYLKTNRDSNQTTLTDVLFDSNTGWLQGSSYTSDWQSWMWKRSAGFTTVAYEGNATSNTQISHDLNAVPQMIWVKQRDADEDWVVGHFGANGGTNPWNYRLELNTKTIQADDDRAWNDTAPTSSNFTLGHLDGVNKSGGDFIALLFTSVSGISKCGYYNGSDNTITITTGFQPRFLIVKRVTGSVNANWHMFDTVRGLGTTATSSLYLNQTDSGNDNQVNMGNISTVSSTGFTLTSNNQWNGNGEKYIYYAHA